MTFLNALMLGGTLAFAVPLVIHLLHRSRYRVVPWGAMHLLESLVRINRRRFRIEQWLLLAIRCAIPALLALCMAQPVLTRWRAPTGDVAASRVVLLDDSYSMQSSAASGTNFQQAVSAALSILERPPTGCESSVVLMGDGSPLLEKPTHDTARLRQGLEGRFAEQGPTRLDTSLQTGLAQWKQSSLARGELIVISDFQRNDWIGPSAPRSERVRELIGTGPKAPVLTLWKLPAPSPDNVCVSSIELSRPVVGVAQPLRVRALVKNFGKRGYDDLQVRFQADGVPLETSQIPLAAGAESSVLFRCNFDRPGSHVIEAEVDADDLSADNRFACVVTVLDRIGVLVVNGDSDAEPLRNETGFLQIALQPFTGAGDKLADLLELRSMDPGQFDRAALDGVRVAILANVPKLTDLQLAALDRFVRSGGGLLVFSGNRMDLNWYDQSLAQGRTPLLPMRYASLRGHLTDSTKQASIVAQRFQHPALNHFNDRRNGNVADGRIFMWYRLDPPTGSQGPTAPSQELMKLAAGDPLMVECRRGEGTVIQVATACDADWSNLPMRPFYLPLMQQLVLHLASTWDPPRNIEIGQPLVARTDESRDNAVTITDPGNVRVDVAVQQVEGHRVVRYDGAKRTGVYTLQAPASPPLHFAVTAPRAESQLETLTDRQMRELADSFGASLVSSLDEYARLDDVRRHGRPVWRIMLVGVLALMAAELLLARRISRDHS